MIIIDLGDIMCLVDGTSSLQGIISKLAPQLHLQRPFHHSLRAATSGWCRLLGPEGSTVLCSLLNLLFCKVGPLGFHHQEKNILQGATALLA